MQCITSIYAPSVEWKGSPEFPGHAHVKCLREEPSGSRTLLVRLAPGSSVSPGAHAGAVQHYVLSGDYESQGVIYQEGTLRLVPAGSKPAAVTTTKGVTFLAVFDPA